MAVLRGHLAGQIARTLWTAVWTKFPASPAHCAGRRASEPILSGNRTSWTRPADKTPYFMDSHLDKNGRPTHGPRSSPICPITVHRCHRVGQNPVLRGRLCWTKKQHTDLSTAPALGFVQTVLRGRSAVHHSVLAVHRSVHAVHRCQKYPATLGIHCGSRT